jgi:hypothetical protein
VTVERKTPAFDALRNLAAQVGGTRVLRVDLPEEEAVKLDNLVATGRPFTKVTPALQQAIVRYVRAQAGAVLTGAGNIRQDVFWRVAADAVKAHVLLRFRAQGNDVHLRSLKPGYREWKALHGLDPRIGFATGALYRALESATWTITPR